MQILVTLKSVYGETKCYPACDKAKGFAQIAGTKTLTQDTLRAIKELGVDIKIDSETMIQDLVTA